MLSKTVRDNSAWVQIFWRKNSARREGGITLRGEKPEEKGVQELEFVPSLNSLRRRRFTVVVPKDCSVVVCRWLSLLSNRYCFGWF